MSAKAKGRTHTDETKAHMSASRLGENNPFFGRTHTDENKEKRKAAMIGNTIKPSISVVVKDLVLNEETTYPSIRKAAEA